LRDKIIEIISEALKELAVEENNQEILALPILLDLPKVKDFGDYATNIAFLLASKLKQNPLKIGEKIASKLKGRTDTFEKVEVVKPGFINFFVNKASYLDFLKKILTLPEEFFTLHFGAGEKVILEFVSANPTGPLHVGHGRGAAIGDSLGRILKACGYEVLKEYYINDAGNQMATLGKSLFLRCQQNLGKEVNFPQECYQGDYLKELAASFVDEYKGKFNDTEATGTPEIFTQYAGEKILNGIIQDLKRFNVSFDSYFSEKSLFKSGKVEQTIKEIVGKGLTYTKENALWFKSTNFGDDKDRVVVKSDGEHTYFASDIAYHKDKFERGFTKIIDIWGADHHGYIPRLKAATQAFKITDDNFKVIIVQFVTLIRNGAPVSMSTRSGEFVTLKEVLDEVGTDAARFFFMLRSSDAHLDFDLDAAKKQNDENPVYYVQYAYARSQSIKRQALERNILYDEVLKSNLNLLSLDAEKEIIKKMLQYPEVLEGCCKALEPHRITFYLNELASIFHSYYNKHRVISDDSKLTLARLAMVESLSYVIKNGLNLIGVSAPEKM